MEAAILSVVSCDEIIANFKHKNKLFSLKNSKFFICNKRDINWPFREIILHQNGCYNVFDIFDSGSGLTLPFFFFFFFLNLYNFLIDLPIFMKLVAKC